MQGEKDLEPGQEKQSTESVSYNKYTLGCMFSLHTYTRYTLHVYICTYTHTGKTICRQDDSRALKDTTVDRLRQVSNNTI